MFPSLSFLTTPIQNTTGRVSQCHCFYPSSERTGVFRYVYDEQHQPAENFVCKRFEYEINFKDSYGVTFCYARVAYIGRYLMSSYFTPHASKTTFGRYICLARLCISWDGLLPFIADISVIETLTRNKTAMPIGLIHISHRQMLLLCSLELPLGFSGIWFAFNSVKTNHKHGRLSTAYVLTCTIRSLQALGDFQRTVDHQCKD